ncbi:hypothetical protein A2230_02760 [candidate division WOR-1 bacterium RIFOXYA2_FULL_36_21]|uniref:Uncharacterized protein n=1 Tax=candidate division WOR-1 bacterium RIFOXYB2_FULL_36_35 TaxID=1802578 RepID=A0A1F4S6M5_UNCSA|nr:MAG: hypothetical protein A2230_02760 [candidate division WOR-1 bacterium RIFOXYA2_FULL_36_21]OGC16074.1 MAG: hypothetical protein A2290_00090 [candidate division WOR-1 bacterium RIFOXYB2_FULL_36_35]OGC19774.1 MAG: hypothetical protein A2282_00875 [candidate division WOR-1 bacterium RIFOXYA12_FULL_36_13]
MDTILLKLHFFTISLIFIASSCRIIFKYCITTRRPAYSAQGDFCINDNFIFEIGGKKKSFKQIKDIDNSYLAIDKVESGIRNKIPLWFFGFLY